MTETTEQINSIEERPRNRRGLISLLSRIAGFHLCLILICYGFVWLCASDQSTKVADQLPLALNILFFITAVYVVWSPLLVLGSGVAFLIRRKTVPFSPNKLRRVILILVGLSWPILMYLFVMSLLGFWLNAPLAYLPKYAVAPNTSKAQELFEKEFGMQANTHVKKLYAWDDSSLLEQNRRIKFYVDDPNVVVAIIDGLKLELVEGEISHMQAVEAIRQSKPEIPKDSLAQSSYHDRKSHSAPPAGANELRFKGELDYASDSTGLQYSTDTGYVDYWNYKSMD